MSAQSFKEYCAALDKLSKAAQLELEDVWLAIDHSNPYVVRDTLIVAVQGIVEKYGGMAALVAAEYYEGERKEALGGDFAALLAESVSPEQIEASVRYACGHLFK